MAQNCHAFAKFSEFTEAVNDNSDYISKHRLLPVIKLLSSLSVIVMALNAAFSIIPLGKLFTRICLCK